MPVNYADIEPQRDIPDNVIDLPRRELPAPICAAELQANPPEVEREVIYGILRRKAKMILSGVSKSGKSFALIALACAISAGGRWFGYQCNVGRVFIANLEITSGSYWRRIESVLAHIPADLANIFVWNLRGCRVQLSELAPQLINHAQEFDVIILDPCYKLLGAASENDASEVAEVLAIIEEIACQTGAAIVMAHHFSKANASERDAIDRPSGSTVFARDPDALCVLTRLRGEDVKDCFRLEWVLRDFRSPEPTVTQFDWPIHKPRPELLDRELAGAPGRPKKAHKATVAEAVATLLLQGLSPTLKAVAAIVGVSEKTVRRRVSDDDQFVIRDSVIMEAETDEE